MGRATYAELCDCFRHSSKRFDLRRRQLIGQSLSRRQRCSSLVIAVGLIASVLAVVSPTAVGANSFYDGPVDYDYSEHYYETPEGYRTTDTDGDGIDPWGCEAYTYPYDVPAFWEIEPDNSGVSGTSASLDARVARDIEEAESRPSDCWYEEWTGTLDYINYLRAYHGMPPVKPWHENDYVTEAALAQTDCECPLRHWTEITDEFSEGFEGVHGVELIALGTPSQFYGSEVHRAWLLDPQVDYVTFARSGLYFVFMAIRSDSRMPFYEHRGFPTLGEHYDDINERHWTVGPEPEPFFSPAINYDVWTRHLRDQGLDVPRPTPDTVDASLNLFPMDPNSQPRVGWQTTEYPEAEELHSQIIVDYVNGLREILNEDDENWPEFSPEPIALYEPPTDRPHPRLESEQGPESDFFFLQYAEEGKWAFDVPVWKHSESTFRNAPSASPLSRAYIDLLHDQRYRILTDPGIESVEISLECRTFDGVPDGGLRFIATAVFDRGTYDYSLPDPPRAHEIADWDQKHDELLDRLEAEIDAQFPNAYVYTENYPCPYYDVETSPIAQSYASQAAQREREEAAAEAIRAREELVANTTCGGLQATIVGTEYEDFIEGTPGDDVIHGLGGDDLIYGYGGNDIICGGAGEDNIWVDPDASGTVGFDDGIDDIYGGPGEDDIHTLGPDRFLDRESNEQVKVVEDRWPKPVVEPPTDPILYCNGLEVTVDLAKGDVPTEGDDVIRGAPWRDHINALGGDDVICSLQGDDYIDGGDGNDIIFAGAGDDVVEGRDGNDKIVGGDGNDVLWGGGGNDRLQGGNGSDTLYGASGRDRLAGNSGHDTIFGGFDNDRIFGHLGRDLLYGGDGNDVIRGGAWLDEMHGGNGTNDGCTLTDPGGLTEVRIDCETGVWGR